MIDPNLKTENEENVTGEVTEVSTTEEATTAEAPTVDAPEGEE